MLIKLPYDGWHGKNIYRDPCFHVIGISSEKELEWLNSIQILLNSVEEQNQKILPKYTIWMRLTESYIFSGLF